MKRDIPDWLHREWNVRTPSSPTVVARVWGIFSCDAMYTLQLTFAPWDLHDSDDAGFKHSHLSAVWCHDADGNPHTFYVPEHACQVQKAYSFALSSERCYMSDNEWAPEGHYAEPTEVV